VNRDVSEEHNAFIFRVKQGAESSVVEESGILPPCGLVNSDFSEEHNAFIFRVKQSRDCFMLQMKTLRLFETSGIISQSAHHNIPEDSFHHEYR